ncbi:reductase [Longispora fulva]|uniref:Nucleoside-diphosphate-sugar epimerase n=1 Tax=Longispora fulva TaxID=619741 RepID=A0A8J7H343_9ACTN|nr:NAD-dependent epimerase/dehydratase family protein [Longispora fulva]MBG6140623.1 nucleoside-diphosphate-sugar epimerase [Longispora fulva]GIG56995.1 reductase [Longispora fulva]
MRMLILGGSVFLSRSIAGQAIAAGHDVTCASRGKSGTAPAGTTFVQLDRSVGLDPLADQTFDAVVDVSSNPDHVREAVKALAGRVGHWTYVSSVSAYADQSVPGQLAHQTPLHDPDDEGYGPNKVACEEAVRGSGVPALICRAGLIVGPGDAIPRFSYWPLRLAKGGEVLVPGEPERLVQYVDVADLSSWLVRSVLEGQTGTFDGTGPARPFGELLTEIAEGVGSNAKLTWVDHDFLLDRGVEPWAGPHSLPLWVWREYAGMLSRDTTPAIAAGLTVRSAAETARTTLDWWHGQKTEPTLAAGLTPEEETTLLRAWHTRNH